MTEAEVKNLFETGSSCIYDLFCKLRQFATDEKKLTKQIKEQQENEMKICATRQKTAYKNNKTRFKKVNKT